MKTEIASSSNVSVKLMDDSVQLEGIVGHWVSKETIH
jgi:hypothetical protein